MKTPIKSFADIPKGDLVMVDVTLPPKQWVKWAPGDMTRDILAETTKTLTQWLDARMVDLVRERVNLEDVQVVHHGNRTLIRINGKDRFEFKMKITMGGT